MIATEGNIKLRVLILSKDLSAEGGVANFARMLIEHFNNSKNIQAEHFPIGNREDAASKLYSSYLAVRDSLRLARKIGKERYDCIHVNPSLNMKSLLRDGLFLLVLLMLGYKNVIIFFHGWEEKTEIFLKRNTVFLALFRHLLMSASAILILGDKFKDSLIDMGVSPKKIKYMSNFFDGSIFKGIIKNTNFNDKKLLFLSRFVRGKGVFETLEAFKLLALEFPDIILILGGDGPEMPFLKERAKEYGIENRVKFPGYVRGASKAQVLEDSDIFVLPTYGEGCPVVLLEAMAAGLPVITCPVGGIPDIFKDEENGILLSKSSPSEIANAIRKLFKNANLRNRISENNKQYAWRNFESHLVIKRIEQVYIDVATQKRTQ